MKKEIERKFLIQDGRWRKKVKNPLPIVQGYLTLDAQCSFRVRTIGKKAFFGIKQRQADDSRNELEIPIPHSDALFLLKKCCIKPLIRKNRYRLRVNKTLWEIDEFLGENRGLIVAEIELTSFQQKIDKPSWLGKDVTTNPAYLNINLVKRPYKNWRKPTTNRKQK